MKKRLIFIFLGISAVITLLILLPFITAETSVPKPISANQKPLEPKNSEELIEALKVWKLIRAVSPTSDQSVPLLAKFNELELLKSNFRREYRLALDKLKQLRDTSATTEEYAESLKYFYQLQKDFVEEHHQIKSEIAKVLTVEQQVKFEVFYSTYRKDLRRTLKALISVKSDNETEK